MWGPPTAACVPLSSPSAWASPVARDGKGRTNEGRKTGTLPDMVAGEQWASPMASDSKGRAGPTWESGARKLANQTGAAWPTPSATPAGSNQGGAAGREGQPRRPTLHTLGKEGEAGRVLSADWVEALMGFPPGWSCPPASPPAGAKNKKRGSRRAR